MNKPTKESFQRAAKQLVDAAYAKPNGRGRTRGLDQEEWQRTLAMVMEKAWEAGFSAAQRVG